MGIGTLIKNRREELGLTLKEIAEACGVSESTVSRWETGGIGNMKRDRIASLAKILRIPASQLVDDPVEEDNEAIAEYLEQIRRRPELRMLMDVSKGATKENIEAIVKLMESIKG